MYACLHDEAIWYGMDWLCHKVLTGDLDIPELACNHVLPHMHPCQPPTWLMLFQIAKTNVGGDGDVVCMNSKLAGMVFDHYAARCWLDL